MKEVLNFSRKMPKVFLMVTTTEYIEKQYSADIVSIEDISELENYGWDNDTSYQIMNTGREVTLSEMEIGDVLVGEYGNASTITRLG